MRFSHLNWPLSPVETLTSLEVNRRSSSLSSTGFLFFNKLILLMLLVVTFPFEILRTHPAPVFLHQERHLESMLRWLTIFPSILDSSLLSGRNHLRIKTSGTIRTLLLPGWWHHNKGWFLHMKWLET